MSILYWCQVILFPPLHHPDFYLAISNLDKANLSYIRYEAYDLNS